MPRHAPKPGLQPPGSQNNARRRSTTAARLGRCSHDGEWYKRPRSNRIRCKRKAPRASTECPVCQCTHPRSTSPVVRAQSPLNAAKNTIPLRGERRRPSGEAKNFSNCQPAWQALSQFIRYFISIATNLPSRSTRPPSINIFLHASTVLIPSARLLFTRN